MKARIQIIGCCVVVVVQAAVNLWMTNRQNAQLKASTEAHNAQLMAQAEVHNAQLLKFTERYKAQVDELTRRYQADLVAQAAKAKGSEPPGGRTDAQ